MSVEYFIKFWGRDDEAVMRYLGWELPRRWFDNESDFKSALEALQNRPTGLIVVWSTAHGQLTHKRTIAIVTLKYNGQTYVFDMDFGHEYPEESVHYMFEDGNYSCDCNRSLFLRQRGHDVPQLDCGETIELLGLKIRYDD